MRLVVVLLLLLFSPVSAELSRLLSYQKMGDAGAYVSSGFHDWRTVSKYRSRAGLHAGYDIAMLANTPVRAAWPGTVVAIAPWYGREYGVTVRDARGYEATYGHISPSVAVGTRVDVGQVLGSVVVDHVDVKMRDSRGNLVDFADFRWAETPAGAATETVPDKGLEEARERLRILVVDLAEKRRGVRLGVTASADLKRLEAEYEELRSLLGEAPEPERLEEPPSAREARPTTDLLLRSSYRVELP